MSEGRAFYAADAAADAAAAERCCRPGLCAYSSAAVRFYRRLRAWCQETGEEPAEAAYSFVHAGEHHAAIIAAIRGCGGGESAQQRWADRLCDVERAEAAGKQTDQEISDYLCPWAVACD